MVPFASIITLMLILLLPSLISTSNITQTTPILLRTNANTNQSASETKSGNITNSTPDYLKQAQHSQVGKDGVLEQPTPYNADQEDKGTNITQRAQEKIQDKSDNKPNTTHSDPKLTNTEPLQVSPPKPSPPLLPTQMPTKKNLLSLNCYGIYLSNLNACVPSECPETYTWNSSSLQCEPPAITCKNNFIWDGVSCMHPLLISNPTKIPTQYIIETNGITCPANLLKCNKPVCPKGFVWLERSCIPTKVGEECPEKNLYYNFCMPNYIAEITIKEACNGRNGYGCAEISNAIKYQNPQSQKTASNSNPIPTQIQQSRAIIPSAVEPTSTSSIISVKNEAYTSYSTTTSKPLVANTYRQISYQTKMPIPTPTSYFISPTPVSSSAPMSYKTSDIDYTIPGVVSPIVKTIMAPSYIPNPVPRYIF